MNNSMNRISLSIFALALSACVDAPETDLNPTEEVEDQATDKQANASGNKTVRITCGQGQRASAGGSYGGVAFSVGCPGSGRTQVITPTGTNWSTRMGVETSSAAYDCAFSGDSSTVSVNCVGTLLTIQ